MGFLSINPMAPGHVLVVPIEEVDHWIDASPDLAAHLFSVAHTIGRAQQAAFGCDRVGVIVAGYEVPHTHVHVIPTSSMAQLSFANAAAIGRAVTISSRGPRRSGRSCARRTPTASRTDTDATVPTG